MLSGFTPAFISRDHSWKCWGTILEPGIKSRLAACNANSLPTVQSLQSSKYIFKYVYSVWGRVLEGIWMGGGEGTFQRRLIKEDSLITVFPFVPQLLLFSCPSSAGWLRSSIVSRRPCFLTSGSCECVIFSIYSNIPFP